jgi:hypothetical protein
MDRQRKKWTKTAAVVAVAAELLILLKRLACQ